MKPFADFVLIAVGMIGVVGLVFVYFVLVSFSIAMLRYHVDKSKGGRKEAGRTHVKVAAFK